jgi:hypothetical protein
MVVRVLGKHVMVRKIVSADGPHVMLPMYEMLDQALITLRLYVQQH